MLARDYGVVKSGWTCLQGLRELYRRYAIVSDADIRKATAKLAAEFRAQWPRRLLTPPR